MCKLHLVLLLVAGVLLFNTPAYPSGRVLKFSHYNDRSSTNIILQHLERPTISNEESNFRYNAVGACTGPGNGGGDSSIGLSGSLLVGGASTNYWFRSSDLGTSCSVSAVISGKGVTVAGSNSECNGVNPLVTLSSADWQPSSVYCITANHNWPNGGCSSGECMITGGPKITGLSFELIHNDDLLIDANPNDAGGLRIFPDKKLPTETINRQRIRVKAQYSQQLAGQTIYFKNFDVDDPSSDSAPIDANDLTRTKSGNDNNGNIDGTTATRAGILHVPASGQPNPYNCASFTQGTFTGVGCQTDSNGIAIVEFTVTKQPGDNFIVVASPDKAYLSGLTFADDGINMKDTNGLPIPTTTTAVNECAADNNLACRTDMLTVWRRLHIEVDSMGSVGDSNNEQGTITASGQTQCPTPPGSCVVRPVLFVDSTLEEQRFNNGRIVFASESVPVFANGYNAGASSQVVFVDGNLTQPVIPGTSFTIFDNDDFNDNDGTNKDGDLHEDVTTPPHSLVENNDVPCPDSQSASNCNVFTPAYVRPIYDLAGNSETPFALNVAVAGSNPSNPSPSDIQPHFHFYNDQYEDDPNFWTIYLNGAYQHDLRADGDGIGSTIHGSADDLNGKGALIYMESTRPSAFGNIGIRRVSRDFTVAHEIGHLFYGTHDDGGLMTPTGSRLIGIFDPKTINKIRGGEFTDISGLSRRITHP